MMSNNIIITEPKKVDNLFTDIQEIKTILKRIEVHNFSSKDKIYSNPELMKELSVSKGTLQNWRDSGKIKFYKISGKIFYKYSDIEECLNNHSSLPF